MHVLQVFKILPFAFPAAVVGVTMCGGTAESVAVRKAKVAVEVEAYGLDLDDCLVRARAVKADGGDGMAAYETCAHTAGVKHGRRRDIVDSGGGR